MILLEGSLPEIPYTVTVKLDGNKEFKFRFLPPPPTTTPKPGKPGTVPTVQPSCNKTTTQNTPVQNPTDQEENDPNATDKVEDGTVSPDNTSTVSAEVPEGITTSGSCRLMASLGILLMAAHVMLFI